MTMNSIAEEREIIDTWHGIELRGRRLRSGPPLPQLRPCQARAVRRVFGVLTRGHNGPKGTWPGGRRPQAFFLRIG